jgi:hypothetical protein
VDIGANDLKGGVTGVWRMRADAKIYKPTGTFSSTFGKAEIGLFTNSVERRARAL